MKPATFEATVIKGKIPDGIRQLIAKSLAVLEGKRVRITVGIAHKKRSLSQNAFYWSTVIPSVRERFKEHGTDIDAEQCHEYLKKNVMGVTEAIIAPDGTQHIVTGKSRDLKTAEWEKNMEKIRAWAATFGCVVPFPHEGICSRL